MLLLAAMRGLVMQVSTVPPVTDHHMEVLRSAG